MTDRADVALGEGASLRIVSLPGRTRPGGPQPLVISTDVVQDGLSVASVQLLEETEYAYEVSGVIGPVVIEPEEMFSASDDTGMSGRLRTERRTGTVVAAVTAASDSVSRRCELEVRSRKLEYLSEYRWMLQRIADEAAEAVQSQFAASSLTAFQPSSRGLAETVYQRFAFIQSLLGTTEFDAAIRLVINRPHHDYVDTQRSIDPSRGMRASSTVSRELVRPGPRQLLPRTNLPLTSLPTTVQWREYAETLDTVPNRFVKHALSSWRSLALEVAEACAVRTGPAARRGAVEAVALSDQLDEYLNSPMFARVGPLAAFPAQNTVLQGRVGYRDVLRAYLQTEAAALVSWSGSDDAFGAGIRDVAALYEYWVFLELARIVETCSGFALDRRPLFRRSSDGMSLDLKRGASAVLRGQGERRGRAVRLELWFNRQFGRGESWTEPLRPDCSLLLRLDTGHGHSIRKWLHFDAKYRVDSFRELFSNADGEVDRVEARPVPQDLLKMHAYRDAIRRTSGAYVLYPGFDEAPTERREFHELLPGLGAFVLRPTEDGRAGNDASHSLRLFLEDAIDHLAASGTDEERSRYWSDLVYREARGRRVDTFALGDKPPADVVVLLGFLRSDQHREWVQSTGLYNLRADDRAGSVGLSSPELGAELVCLYDATSDDVWWYRSTGALILRTAADLQDLRYPHQPGGRLYCCVALGDVVGGPSGVTGELARRRARRDRPTHLWAAPVACRLDELLPGAGT